MNHPGTHGRRKDRRNRAHALGLCVCFLLDRVWGGSLKDVISRRPSYLVERWSPQFEPRKASDLGFLCVAACVKGARKAAASERPSWFSPSLRWSVTIRRPSNLSLPFLSPPLPSFIGGPTRPDPNSTSHAGIRPWCPRPRHCRRRPPLPRPPRSGHFQPRPPSPARATSSTAAPPTPPTLVRPSGAGLARRRRQQQRKKQQRKKQQALDGSRPGSTRSGGPSGRGLSRKDVSGLSLALSCRSALEANERTEEGTPSMGSGEERKAPTRKGFSLARAPSFVLSE